MSKLHAYVREHVVRGTGQHDRGATAVEYGLLVALIALVIIGVVTLLGGHLSGIFGSVANSLPHSTAP
jgi:pilus assembly protein Flp/PilA